LLTCHCLEDPSAVGTQVRDLPADQASCKIASWLCSHRTPRRLECAVRPSGKAPIPRDASLSISRTPRLDPPTVEAACRKKKAPERRDRCRLALSAGQNRFSIAKHEYGYGRHTLSRTLTNVGRFALPAHSAPRAAKLRWRIPKKPLRRLS
jgi:hypothetical protein